MNIEYWRELNLFMPEKPWQGGPPHIISTSPFWGRRWPFEFIFSPCKCNKNIYKLTVNYPLCNQPFLSFLTLFVHSLTFPILAKQKLDWPLTYLHHHPQQQITVISKHCGAWVVKPISLCSWFKHFYRPFRLAYPCLVETF